MWNGKKENNMVQMTLSVLKADVGSIGGHTKPSDKMIQATEEAAAQAARPLVVDERERRTRRVRLPGLEAAQAIGPRLV